MLSAATAALSRLDSAELQKLEERAVRLQAMLASRALRVTATPEVRAQHRVFAGVVQATGENLGVLERTGSLGVYGARRLRDPWAH